MRVLLRPSTRAYRGLLAFAFGSPWLAAIEHTKTKAYHPQTNGICERFHKTILNEFYEIAFRKKIYNTIEELQKDLDDWLNYYNNERTHQGKICCGRTPMQTFLDGKSVWDEKVTELNLH